MRGKKFCCDASRDMYEDYYIKQSGGGGAMPVFAGARFQKGHGLGSILSGLFRRVLPFLRANGRNFAGNLIDTGLNVAQDVLNNGKKFGESLKERVPEGIKRTVQDLKFQSGSGFGKRRRLTLKLKKKKKIAKKQPACDRDIFNGFRSRSIL
jgi:hypothetical protein